VTTLRDERAFPRITEAGLDHLRERLGKIIENPPEPRCYEATRDNINQTRFAGRGGAADLPRRLL
jgi:hypothetical protein